MSGSITVMYDTLSIAIWSLGMCMCIVYMCVQHCLALYIRMHFNFLKFILFFLVNIFEKQNFIKIFLVKRCRGSFSSRKIWETLMSWHLLIWTPSTGGMAMMSLLWSSWCGVLSCDNKISDTHRYIPYQCI